MYCLLDANNFYVSAERIFMPSLAGRPVIVLSHNDGCAIARSEEAKALGVPMGLPYFQVRQRFPNAGLVALSANFALYGALSARLMDLAAGLGPTQEVYSIDETFIGLHGVGGCLTARTRAMRQRILQWIGLPCGAGIGPTKTLAKLANHVAKAAERRPGSYPPHLAQVCDLAALTGPERDAVLQATPAAEVWGIGPRIAAQLEAAGIRTALEAARIDPAAARRRWGVGFERTVRELGGTACLPLEDAPPPRGEIVVSRAFGRPVERLADLAEAVSTFASQAAERLRRQELHAGQVLVFLHASPHRPLAGRHSCAARVPLARAGSDTVAVVAAALAGLRAVHRPGHDFVKSGVHLLDLRPARLVQSEMGLEEESPARARLMAAMDRINRRHGPGTLALASAGLGGDRRPWTMQQAFRTPNYLGSWDELPVARA